MSRELDILEFTEGNPGCIQFLMIASQRPEILDIIKLLRETGLKGSRAYQLWNDCCNRDMDQVAAVADAYVNGRMSKKKILDHVDLPFGEPFTTEDLKDNGIKIAVVDIELCHPTTAMDTIFQTKMINRAVNQCAEQLFGAKDIGKRFGVSIEAETNKTMGRNGIQIKMVKKEIG